MDSDEDMGLPELTNEDLLRGKLAASLGDPHENKKRSYGASTLGVKEGESSFVVPEVEDINKRARIPREDGRNWPSWIPDPSNPEGARYGPAVRSHVEERFAALESDPNYQFITEVAGATNASVIDMYDPEDLARAEREDRNRQAIEREQRDANRLKYGELNAALMKAKSDLKVADRKAEKLRSLIKIFGDASSLIDKDLEGMRTILKRADRDPYEARIFSRYKDWLDWIKPFLGTQVIEEEDYGMLREIIEEITKTYEFAYGGYEYTYKGVDGIDARVRRFVAAARSPGQPLFCYQSKGVYYFAFDKGDTDAQVARGIKNAIKNPSEMPPIDQLFDAKQRLGEDQKPLLVKWCGRAMAFFVTRTRIRSDIIGRDLWNDTLRLYTDDTYKEAMFEASNVDEAFWTSSVESLKHAALSAFLALVDADWFNPTDPGVVATPDLIYSTCVVVHPDDIAHLNVTDDLVYSKLRKRTLEIDAMERLNREVEERKKAPKSAKSPPDPRFPVMAYERWYTPVGPEQYQKTIDDPYSTLREPLFRLFHLARVAKMFEYEDILRERTQKKELEDEIDNRLRNVLMDRIEEREETTRYEHRRAYVERPENSGRVRLKPIVVKAISMASDYVRQYVPWAKGIDDLEFLQHDPVSRSTFAELVGVCIAKSTARFPKTYTNQKTAKQLVNRDLRQTLLALSRRFKLGIASVPPPGRGTTRVVVRV
jgi:hypothetical protein